MSSAMVRGLARRRPYRNASERGQRLLGQRRPRHRARSRARLAPATRCRRGACHQPGWARCATTSGAARASAARLESRRKRSSVDERRRALRAAPARRAPPRPRPWSPTAAPRCGSAATTRAWTSGSTTAALNVASRRATASAWRVARSRSTRGSRISSGVSSRPRRRRARPAATRLPQTESGIAASRPSRIGDSHQGRLSLLTTMATIQSDRQQRVRAVPRSRPRASRSRRRRAAATSSRAASRSARRARTGCGTASAPARAAANAANSTKALPSSRRGAAEAARLAAARRSPPATAPWARAAARR